MAQTTIDTWDGDFIQRSPLFEPLSSVVEFAHGQNDWPCLQQLEEQFKRQQLAVRPVPQGDKPEAFEQHYEPRIYLKGELQTRTENWHDFFNAMVWLRFPKTKAALNQLHYRAAKQRQQKTNRSPRENAITLFDECGAIIISDQKSLIDMVRKHRWQELFIQHRYAFDKNIQCIVFGHAMYEKALKPYLGMTCHVLFIEADQLPGDGLFNDISDIDSYLANYWLQGHINSTKDLQPLPILGVPGWHQGNGDPAFYDNVGYFRPRKTV